MSEKNLAASVKQSETTEPKRFGGWALTYTGLKFWPLDPRPEELCIEDIAHGLALNCRFAGQCQRFYSVAEHSLLVWKILKETGQNITGQLQGLLHDAEEGLVGDMIRPLKYGTGMNCYRSIVEEIRVMIFRKFGLPREMHWTVKYADKVALMTERRDAMPPRPGEGKWLEEREGILPHAAPLEFMTPETAEARFLMAFDALAKEAKAQGIKI
jgi:5'-deoxynucleotidase YfbR-like HD superfamily hydrolase